MQNNGTVTIPVEKYDFLKGLELLMDENNIYVVGGYWGTKYYTRDLIVKSFSDDIILLKQKIKDIENNFKNMSVREFKQYKSL